MTTEANHQTGNGYMKGLVTGLILGIVVGGVAGAVLPTLISERPTFVKPLPGQPTGSRVHEDRPAPTTTPTPAAETPQTPAADPAKAVEPAKPTDPAAAPKADPAAPK